MRTTWKLTSEIELTSEEMFVVSVLALGAYAIGKIVQLTTDEGQKKNSAEESSLGFWEKATSAPSAYPIAEICTSDRLAAFPLHAATTRGRTGIGIPSTVRTRAQSSTWSWFSLPPYALLLVYTITRHLASFPTYTSSRYYWVVL